ncbi:acyltransferase [Alphaproteobacteria bacterium]|nr:acyltransferase [Alphaproteobacteria bacterium]
MFFFDASGSITIGDYVMIGPDTKIYSSNHDLNHKGNMLLSKKIIKKPVIIGSNIWIGANVIILPGIKSEDGTIIGAGSIVTKSILQKNTIYAGNPAKFIKKRI